MPHFRYTVQGPPFDLIQEHVLKAAYILADWLIFPEDLLTGSLLTLPEATLGLATGFSSRACLGKKKCGTFVVA
jgi:hypothetical protein